MQMKKNIEFVKRSSEKTMSLRLEILVVLLVSVKHVLPTPTPQGNHPLNFDEQLMRNDNMSRSRRIELNGTPRFPGSLQNKKSTKTSIGENHDCGDTFCTADPNYPADYVSSLNLDKFEHLFGDDFVDNFAVRFDPDESGLCSSRKRLIHPKKGQTVQNTWLTIINDENKYRQGVLVEECLNAHLPCEYSQNFPLGVESNCKQQYVYRSLLAINQEGKPVMEHFQFPSCCKCMVTSSRSYNRFGDSDDDERRDRLILA